MLQLETPRVFPSSILQSISDQAAIHAGLSPADNYAEMLTVSFDLDTGTLDN